jgi:hypothetical protein
MIDIAVRSAATSMKISNEDNCPHSVRIAQEVVGIEVT